MRITTSVISYTCILEKDEMLSEVKLIDNDQQQTSESWPHIHVAVNDAFTECSEEYIGLDRNCFLVDFLLAFTDSVLNYFL